MPKVTLEQATTNERGRLSRADAATYVGAARSTLADWQLKGLGPKSHKVGNRRFYYVADLNAFIRGVGR